MTMTTATSLTGVLRETATNAVAELLDQAVRDAKRAYLDSLGINAPGDLRERLVALLKDLEQGDRNLAMLRQAIKTVKEELVLAEAELKTSEGYIACKNETQRESWFTVNSRQDQTWFGISSRLHRVQEKYDIEQLEQTSRERSYQATRDLLHLTTAQLAFLAK